MCLLGESQEIDLHPWAHSQQRMEKSEGACFREGLSTRIKSSSLQLSVANLAENQGPSGQIWSN